MAEKEAKKFLALDPPDRIRFVGDLRNEVKTVLKITNQSEMKQAYKVKCTRNDMFRIRPATGILDYGQTLLVTLTYRAHGDATPESDKHHFGVYHIPAPEGCTCEGAWSEHYGPPQGEHRLKVDLKNKADSV